jgi:hypothetical protein
MPLLDIYGIVPCASLMTPLAGIGRSLRPYAADPPPVAPVNAVAPARRARLSVRWRRDSDGALIMEWTA